MKKSASLKLLTVAAAGTCLLAASPLVSAAAGLPSATVAPASSQTAQSAVTVTSKEVNDKNDLYSAKLQIPVLSGMQDSIYQTKLNEQLESQAMSVLDDLKKTAAADQEASKTGGYEFRPYEMEITYAVKSDGSGQNGTFSLVVSTYTYTGGAHGSTVEDTYNVQNAAAASPLTLKQLLGSDYLKLANAAVAAELKANPDRYYPQDGSDAFKSIADDQSFFVSQGTVYLVFQQYEIGPYASGIVEIPVQPASVSAQPPKKQSLTLAPAAANKAGDAHYFVDAKGHVMVPLRTVASSFGYKVSWNNATKAAQVSSDQITASVPLGKNSYALTGKTPIPLTAASVSISGTIYVPDDFFSQMLGLNVTESPTGGNLTIHN
ncbi:PdaC/SigV domain-containing protein [Cohnella zeiphila]|uniref:DUF4163 domain-containing protein n=1 Tax=Cohnella zeiphila TaxID=2761120 RepID=A0A7X0VXR2_9BACL|nr:DUF4163 domain-containing protein [Cohnella zeiphila]